MIRLSCRVMSVKYASVRFLSGPAVWAVISRICHTAALPGAWLRFTTVCVCVCCSSVIKHFHMHGDLPVCAPCHPRGGYGLSAATYLVLSALTVNLMVEWRILLLLLSCQTSSSDWFSQLRFATPTFSPVSMQLNQNDRHQQTTSWCLKSSRTEVFYLQSHLITYIPCEDPESKINFLALLPHTSK